MIGGGSARAVLLAGVAVVLVWLAALDLEHRLIPNRVVLPASGVMLLAQAVLVPGRLPELAAASLGAAVFFLVFTLAKPGALGMGDVKLGFLLGAAFGMRVVPVLAIGCLAASFYGAGVVLVHGRAGLVRTIPLAPFLAFGAIAWIIGTGA